jgi:ABC-type multidrug transport system fused ATPase/permease subunit
MDARFSNSMNNQTRLSGQVARLAGMARDIFASADKADCRVIAFGGCAVILSSLILTAAPILLAGVFSDGDKALDVKSLMMMLGFFLAARAIGQVLIDARWLILNPLYYRIAYRSAAVFCERMVDRGELFTKRANNVAEVSEAVAAIQKVQINVMALTYNFGSIVAPTAIDVVLASIAVYLTVGAAASLFILLGVVIFLFSTWALNAPESEAFDSAVRADNSVYREVGQIFGFSKLIVEFSCFDFFRRRLAERISTSSAAHLAFFKVKFLRASARTAATAGAYLFVAAYIAWATFKGANFGPKQIFLIVSFLDRTMTPLGAISTAVTGIQNALVAIGAGSAFFASDRGVDRYAVSIEGRAEAVAVQFMADGAPIRFVLRPGAVMRVSGPSGAGKSRFLHALFDALRHTWPGVATYLSEKPLIVEGSVEDNLKLGNSKIRHENALDVWIRASRIGIAPDRDADALSAGEMQILAACRALLREPDLLIVDEGFSSMDSESERRVFALLRAMRPNAIVIFVAHRTALELCFDLELAFDDGRARLLARRDSRFVLDDGRRTPA